MSSPYLISCLCVTENRAPFMPWLLWSYDRQTWKHKELVIVDSSYEPLVSARPNVRVLHARPGLWIKPKRDMALRVMRGEALAWFDDDDWQHPERLERIAEALQSGAGVAGTPHTWLIDLERGACTRHIEPGERVLFNSAGFTRALAQSSLADPKVQRFVSDTDWCDWCARQPGVRADFLSGPALTVLLCHRWNASNVPSRWRLEEPLEALQAEVGAEAWGETDRELEALRERLAHARRPPHWAALDYFASEDTRSVRKRGGGFSRRSPYRWR